MYKVNSDPSKNRLYITFELFDETIIKALLKDLSDNVKNLSSGYTCLVDIRKMTFEENAKGTEYIEIIQGALIDLGMKKVVRVIDKNNIKSQKAMDERSSSLGYIGEPVYSIEEAEKILDNFR